MGDPGGTPAQAVLDLSTPRRLHVVGIGGAGMGPIAEVLAAMGHEVSGSDLNDSPRVGRLRRLGLVVHVGHDTGHVDGAEVVIISTAVRHDNAEVVAARERDIPVLRRAQALAAITACRRTVAVTGTHGKTTTSAMLAVVLTGARLRPSFLIGGDVLEEPEEVTQGGRRPNDGQPGDPPSGARWGEGEWLVVEADESDGTFLELSPEMAIVTSVEPDHLDHYGDFHQVVAAFDRFLESVPGTRVVCADDAQAAKLAVSHRAITYGTDAGADYRIVAVESKRWEIGFTLERNGVALGNVTLAVPGMHNARNAAAAVVTSLACGATFEDAALALSRYGGVARRFQPRGEWNGATLVEDYAHLPTEVVAALDTARSGGWRRVVCVYQPHRYSRMAALWRDFAGAFAGADVLVVTEIYSAGEHPQPSITGKLVVDAILDADPFRRVAWFPDREDVISFLERELRPGDMCLVLGAGDITSVPDELLARGSGQGGDG